MRYRRLGSSELEVSEIALGSWLTYGVGVDKSPAMACVRQALDLGINFIDTANIYGRGAAETLLGEVLAPVPRDSYVLATKLFFPMTDADRGLSRAQIIKQLEASRQYDLARPLRQDLARYQQGETCLVPWVSDDPIFTPDPSKAQHSTEAKTMEANP